MALNPSPQVPNLFKWANGNLASVPDAGGGVASGDWVVFSSNPEYAPLPLYPVYPRPDAETSAKSYHRKAHTGITYRVKILAQGGGWPFKGEIVSAPSGASFVSSEFTRTTDPDTGKTLHTRPAGYIELQWDASAEAQSSAHDFHVRVTDQQGASVDYQWQAIVDNDAFIEVNSSTGSDAATGAIGDPLQTFANGLWKNSDEDTTFAGKIVVFNGTFTINSGTNPSDPVLDGSKKPVAYMAGSSGAVFDMSQGHFSAPGISDHAFIDIAFTGSRTDQPGTKLFLCNGLSERNLWWGCTFSNNVEGTGTANNPACIAFMSLGSGDVYHGKNCVVECELKATNVLCLVKTFDTNYILAQSNKTESGINISASNGAMMIQFKDDTSNATARDNFFDGEAGTGFIDVPNQNTKGTISNQELCFNTGICGSSRGIYWNSAGDAQNAHDYLNTTITTADARRILGSVANPVTLIGNAYAGGIDNFDNPILEPGAANIQLAVSDFDAAGKLTGQARTDNLGSASSEIAEDSQ